MVREFADIVAKLCEVRDGVCSSVSSEDQSEGLGFISGYSVDVQRTVGHEPECFPLEQVGVDQFG
jgi:hypothetical protein